ncbi:fatty acid-binding protein, muscle [Planococcus citri]|uniref:fatty acid-binding protein, muscle n=1 Tax=Planococcus citri TaxID=170843 RepID=UPI0031F91BCB
MGIENISNCFGKKYKLDLESSKNFDEYMKAIGVGLITRKVGQTVKPVVELKQEEDGKLTLSSKSTFKNVSITFNLDEEFPEETLDGRKVKSVITLEDNKLIQVQKNGKESTIIREFTPEEVKMTLKVDDIVCTRVYKVLNE